MMRRERERGKSLIIQRGDWREFDDGEGREFRDGAGEGKGEGREG